jgi:hypothetical protein
MVTGSNACKSLKILPFAPLPPKMIIFEPARTAEWAYLGVGGVPEILGFYIKRKHYCEFIGINIQDISIVEVGISFGFSRVVVTSKNDYRGS